MMNKLKQQCGETLIEALISLLIAVISMGVLSSAVVASSRLNAAKREKDNEYKQQMEIAEGMSDDAVDSAKLHITFDKIAIDGNNTITEEINLYGGEENSFASYQQPNAEDAP